MTTPRSSRRLLLTAATAALALAIPAVAAASVSFFHSPTGNISCQMSSGGQIDTSVLCQTLKPARSATLHAGGTTTVCAGQGCLGNGPENAFTLRYRHGVAVGPFRCVSSLSGMHCFVVRTGHGFRISAQGVKRS